MALFRERANKNSKNLSHKCAFFTLIGANYHFRFISFNRNGSPPSTGGIHSISSLLTIPPLYHYPHPNLPVFTSMGFEVLFLCYLVSALVLQHVNIYKTVGACLILFKLYSGR